MRILYTLLFLSGFLGAQSDQTTVLLDRGYHAAGEVVRLAVFSPPNGPETIQLDVFAPNGERLDYFFLSGVGTVEGYYRWPFDAATGYYQLVATALSGEGSQIELASVRHPVYSLADRKREPDPGSLAPTATFTGPPVTVSGGQIQLGNIAAGTYAVSVVNRSVTGRSGKRLYGVDPPMSPTGYQDTIWYRGEIASTEDDSPLVTNLLPVFDVATLRTYFTKTTPEGEFTLSVPPFEGSKQLHVRPLKNTSADADLRRTRRPAISERPPLTQEVLDYLDLANRRRKIYQLYGTVEAPLEGQPARQEEKELQANKSFNVPDYQAFPDLATFFREVAGELRVRQRKESYSARLYNAPNQRFFESTPLFIVDGRLTQDVDYVMQLNPADVQRVSFFYDNRPLRRDFPALGNNGVVRIDLIREGKPFPTADAANLLRVNGLQPASPFGPVGEGVPRLSPLRLWAVGTHSGGELTVPLPPTDDPGEYLITVVSRNAVSGKLQRSEHIQLVQAGEQTKR